MQHLIGHDYAAKSGGERRASENPGESRIDDDCNDQRDIRRRASIRS